jgi:hypothetical protein
MVATVGVLVSMVFAILSLLHLYWAAGGRWGVMEAVPEVARKPAFTPGPVACIVVALLLAAAAAIVSLRAGLWQLASAPGWLALAGTWTVAAVMALRAIGDGKLIGFSKRVRGTPFARWDSRLYSPLCLLLACGCALVALGS